MTTKSQMPGKCKPTLPPCVSFNKSSKGGYRTYNQIRRFGRVKAVWTIFDDKWEAYLHYEIVRRLEKLIPNANDKRYTKNKIKWTQNLIANQIYQSR